MHLGLQTPAVSLGLSSWLACHLRAEVFEQAGEGGLEGVVLLPVREVGDEGFAQLDGFLGVVESSHQKEDN